MVEAFWTDKEPEIALYHGDCRTVMAQLEAESVDSIVCDPPYGLEFMGKDWDKPTQMVGDAARIVDGNKGAKSRGFAGNYRRNDLHGKMLDYQRYMHVIFEECLRVLKPGAHLLAFGGSRTYHRLACAIEDAGFEIRDQIQWLYGSGFPKSLDVSKAIDAAAGAQREIVGENPYNARRPNAPVSDLCQQAGWPSQITAPATDAAKRWNGWGTALKPAHEPIVLARKPLIRTVAENVLQHGTGGLNIDGCRIETEHKETRLAFGKPIYGGNAFSTSSTHQTTSRDGDPAGRWPANVIHDGSDEVLAGFPEAQAGGPRGGQAGREGAEGSPFGSGWNVGLTHGDSGSAARFFYCAKADKADRTEGLETMPERVTSVGDERTSGQMNQRLHGLENRKTLTSTNHHPTVKPTDLMRYLCRLITPPKGLVLDPFCGSGSTGKAARAEGFRFIGIEINEEYCALAAARCEIQQRSLFGE